MAAQPLQLKRWLRQLTLLLVAASLLGCARRAPLPSLEPGPPEGALDVEVMALYLRAEYASQHPAHGPAVAAALLQQAVARAPGEARLWAALARAWAAEGDAGAAIGAATRAVELDPDDVPARYLLGEQLLREGKPASAEPHLAFAAERGLTGTRGHLPHYYLHVALREQDRIDDAALALDAWARARPKDPHPPAYKARLYWDHGRADDAAEAALDALRRDPDNEEPRRILLQAWELTPLRIAERLESVLRFGWSSAVLHRTMVSLYEEAARPEDALEHLRFVEILDPEAGDGLSLQRARLQLDLGNAEAVLRLLPDRPEVVTGHEAVRGALLQAEALARLGRIDEARARCGAVVGPGERLGQAFVRRAELTLRFGAFDRASARQALAELEAAIDGLEGEAVDAREEALRGLLRLRIEHKLLDGALPRLAQLEGLAPAAAARLSIDLLQVGGDAVGALQALRSLREENGERLGLVSQEAELLAAIGELDEARDAVAAAMARIDGRREEVLREQTGERAIRAHHDALRGRLYLLRQLAWVEGRSGDLRAAEATLRRALELAPEDADLLNALGYLWAEHGLAERYEEGLDLLRRAHRLRPSPAIEDSLGWLLFRVGRLDEAWTYVSRAAQRHPGDREILDHLAAIEEARGHNAAARDAWRQARQRAIVTGEDPARYDTRLEALAGATEP